MQLEAIDNSTAVPTELCGYAVERCLTPGHSYLAAGPGGRKIVLKKMDEDCLLGGDLHPSIRERLSRVRELAHAGVANLHGAARDGESAYMIWEFVPGQTFDQYIADPLRTQREILLLARELILSVDSLHMQGIVHGALIGGNVIVAPEGQVRLTHVSPLLYTDTATDIESVMALLADAAEIHSATESPLASLANATDPQQISLRNLGSKIAVLLESRESTAAPSQNGEDRHVRRRMLLAVVLVTVVAIIVAYGIWRFTEGASDLHGSFPWAQRSADSK
jgi:serine/threonine protein kinase